eukprot:TRINITY_DN1508_c0_g1_i4.p1 TRINITY_DN1508_c0_g1~~TRINITY_DN1508_c0_g1_i4.p1  ORF type:complete len:1003 (-),score=159.35 TRINITY_DN1508_c0_g1_i4:2913-5921(-)
MTELTQYNAIPMEAPPDRRITELSFKQQSGCLAKHRSVSSFWSEKFFVILDYLQVYAVLIYSSRAWPFPYAWLNWTNWTLMFNLDLLNLSLTLPSSSAQFGWIAAWCFVPYGIFASLGILVFIAKISKGKRYLQARARLFYIYAFVFEAVWIPWCLQASRIAMCNSSSVLTYANDVQCLSVAQIFIAVIAVGGAILMHLVPLAMFIFIRRQLVSPRTSDHETFMHLKETEYVVDLDDTWLIGNFWLFAPFKRRTVYHRPFLLVVKSLFVFFAVFFNKDGTTASSVGGQAYAMLALLFVYQMYTAVMMPYRMLSTSFMVQALGWANVLNMIFGALLSAKISSPLLVASVLTVWLLFFNILGIFLMVVAVVVMIYRQCTGTIMWPVVYELARSYTDETVSSTVKEARALVKKSLSTVKYFVRVDNLEKQIQIVSDMYLKSVAANDPLRVSLLDVLEDLINTFNALAPISLLPRPALERELPEFRKRLDQRDLKLTLLNPQSRLLILLMMVVRAFMGHRRLRRLVLVECICEEVDAAPEEAKAAKPEIAEDSGTDSDEERFQALLLRFGDTNVVRRRLLKFKRKRPKQAILPRNIFVYDLMEPHWKNPLTDLPENQYSQTFWAAYFRAETIAQAGHNGLHIGEFHRVAFADGNDTRAVTEGDGRVKLITAKGRLYIVSHRDIVCHTKERDILSDLVGPVASQRPKTGPAGTTEKTRTTPQTRPQTQGGRRKASLTRVASKRTPMSRVGDDDWDDGDEDENEALLRLMEEDPLFRNDPLYRTNSVEGLNLMTPQAQTPRTDRTVKLAAAAAKGDSDDGEGTTERTSLLQRTLSRVMSSGPRRDSRRSSSGAPTRIASSEDSTDPLASLRQAMSIRGSLSGSPRRGTEPTALTGVSPGTPARRQSKAPAGTPAPIAENVEQKMYDLISQARSIMSYEVTSENPAAVYKQMKKAYHFWEADFLVQIGHKPSRSEIPKHVKSLSASIKQMKKFLMPGAGAAGAPDTPRM